WVRPPWIQSGRQGQERRKQPQERPPPKSKAKTAAQRGRCCRSGRPGRPAPPQQQGWQALNFCASRSRRQAPQQSGQQRTEKKEQRSYRRRYAPKSHRYSLARPKDCNSGLLFSLQRPWLGDGWIERDNTCETPFICLDGQYYRKNSVQQVLKESYILNECILPK